MEKAIDQGDELTIPEPQSTELPPTSDNTTRTNGETSEVKQETLPKDPVTLSWEETK